MTADEIRAATLRLLPRPDTREIWEWAEDRIDFGNTEAFKGRFNIKHTPWWKEFYRAFKSPKVRRITVIAPPQESGKTTAAEVCLLWQVANFTSRCAFNTVTNNKAKRWADTRWRARMKACKAVQDKLSSDRNDTTKGLVLFRDGGTLIIQGAESEGNRQSDSVEVQINDEGYLWESPWMDDMEKRTLAYRDTRKIVHVSVGGMAGGELHQRFQGGTQHEWMHHCPHCRELFAYTFPHLPGQTQENCSVRFDAEKAIRKPDGSIDFTEFDATVHVACPHCQGRIDYEPDLMARLNKKGQWVQRNTGADTSDVSLHVNAFALGRRPWAEIVRPWIHALKGALNGKDLQKEFVQKELAEFWEDRPVLVETKLTLGKYTRAQMRQHGAWPEEVFRFMFVDNQHGKAGDVPHRWFVCRAFAADGSSRLVDCGRINEWEDVRRKQQELGVKDVTPEMWPWSFVVVDRGYDVPDVERQCMRWKWMTYKGEAERPRSDGYLHETESGVMVTRLFSTIKASDYGIGTAQHRVGEMGPPYILFNAQKVQDVLAMLRSGRGPSWEVPQDILDFCPDYQEQINSHHQVPTGQGGLVWKRIGSMDDHLYDCEQGVLVCALRAGLLA